MQITVSVIVFLAIFAAIWAQNNAKAVEDLSENEANDLSLLKNYNMMIKKMLSYGVPFFEGNKSRQFIINHFRNYPSTNRPSHLDHNPANNKAKEDVQKDEEEIRKTSLLFYYKKYLENLIKYGIQIQFPNKERYSTSKGRPQFISEYSTSKGRVQYQERIKK